ncbi:hypothetical protein Bca101_096724 [Brassica carinata]
MKSSQDLLVVLMNLSPPSTLSEEEILNVSRVGEDDKSYVSVAEDRKIVSLLHQHFASVGETDLKTVRILYLL